MTRLSFRRRRREALETFETGFTSPLTRFAAEFVNSDAVKHAASKGDAREEPVKNFLADHLPKAFGVRKGEAVDVHDHLNGPPKQNARRVRKMNARQMQSNKLSRKTSARRRLWRQPKRRAKKQKDSGCKLRKRTSVPPVRS